MLGARGRGGGANKLLIQESKSLVPYLKLGKLSV